MTSIIFLRINALYRRGFGREKRGCAALQTQAEIWRENLDAL